MTCSEKSCALSVPKAEAKALADTLVNAKDGEIVTRPGGVRFRVTNP